MNIEAFFMPRGNGKTTRLIERFLINPDDSIILTAKLIIQKEIINNISAKSKLNSVYLKDKIRNLKKDCFRGERRAETTLLIDDYFFIKNKDYIEDVILSMPNISNIIIFTSFDKHYRVVDNKVTKYDQPDFIINELNEESKEKHLQLKGLLSHPNLKQYVFPNILDNNTIKRYKDFLKEEDFEIQVNNCLSDQFELEYDNNYVITTT